MKILALLFGTLCSAAALSQITPNYAYNGINRPLWARVKIPNSEAGRAEILLLAPVTAEVVSRAEATDGIADLAAIFPDLWKTKKPRLLYAQLVIGGRRIGPAVVLQPMTNPKISRLAKDDKTVEFVPDEDQAYAGIRAWVDKELLLETSLGNIRFRLRPDCAPNTTWNIMQLVEGGFYRDVIWHRVVAVARGNPFVIQGGDPTGSGNGGPGFAYPLEDSPLPHDFGVISIARSTDPNTNGCQFFVCLSREGTARLDHKYASFGEAILGGDTILKTAAVAVGKEDRPNNPPLIKRARLVDAAPYGTGPKPVKRPAPSN